MIESYDALEPPDPKEWLALAEGERIALVVESHAGQDVPHLQLHAAFHVMVENQAAMGDEIPVGANLQRLMAEGLDRHDAIHAIGSILADHLAELMDDGDAKEDASEAYYEKVQQLTAAEWLNSADD